MCAKVPLAVKTWFALVAILPRMTLQTFREHPCPICWEMQVAMHDHEVVASCEDERALIEALVGLGVRWNAHVDPNDATARAFELLRMIDDAAEVGFDCAEVGGRWVVTPRRRPTDDIAA